MKNKVTIIITIRNRDVSRIENQVNSIRKYGANPTIHIIDYGSDEVFKNQYEVISNKLGIQYTHMFAEGLPWNKCRAINYGVKNATTPFIVTSDVDMIYTSNPFQWCIDNYEEKTIYHIPTFWLPKNGKISKSLAAGIGNSGGFLFSKREDMTKYGEFRECHEESDIFIYPGYEFKAIDALITNFHLPKSTLIMLVSALASKKNIMEAYKHAVEEKYRFFSFGDAMFIK